MSSRPLPAPSALHTARATLRQRHIRLTEARLQVLALLQSSTRAWSHLDLQQALPDTDRVTLYRALDCLSGAGIAHKIASDDRIFRYSSSPQHPETDTPHPHGHFKCTRCTRVFCLDEQNSAAHLTRQLQQDLAHTLTPGFQSHDIELTIKGWCADCAS